MNGNFEIVQLQITDESLQELPNRLRNQLCGCMHAQNELTVLNRILLFSMNATGEGDLHDAARSIQMWCLLQVLAGKLFETWNMLATRFLAASPEDPAVAQLSEDHKLSLAWLRDYFGSNPPKENALRTIRDKTAFHYDKLNLEEAARNLASQENALYLAQHPANSLYYLGSALVFRTVFAMIADKAGNTTGLCHDQRTVEGFRVTVEDTKLANWHMHMVLYGLMRYLLESALKKPLDTLDQVRINVTGALDPATVRLPTFIAIEGADRGGI